MNGSFIVLILLEYVISITFFVSLVIRYNKFVKFVVIYRIVCGSRCRGDNDF